MRWHGARLWIVALSLLVGAPALADDPPQTGPTLGEAARELWRKVPDSVKARAKEKLVEIIEKSFGGVRPVPPPPPLPMTAKEKKEAEKARKAELAKLKKLEKQRKAEAARAEREARAAAKKAAKEGKQAAPTKDDKATPAAVAAAPAVAPPAVEDLREVEVPLERRGSSYYVTVRLNGQVEASYLYDTGASLTTVDSSTLGRLGVQIPQGAPTIRTQTANGVVEVPILVLDSIEVGGARIAGGFTVSQCEPCSDGRKSGLLGLNFSRRYLTTIDESKGVLRLVPRVDALDHRFDLEPFLQYQGVKGSMQNGVFHVSGSVLNRAPRTASNVRVAAILVDAKEKEVGRLRGRIGTIPAGGTTQFQFSGKVPAFSKFYLELDGADW